MFIRRHSRPLLGILIGILLGAGGFLHEASGQEYLQAENDAPKSLKDRSRPFDGVTIRDEIYETGFVIPALIDAFPPMEPVVRNSSFRLEPRSYYFYREFSNGRISEAWTLGGSLSYESGWWRGLLKWGGAAYTSQRLHGPPDRDGTGLLQSNQQPYSTLGTAYLKVKLRHSVATLYRQEIDLPYVNRNDSRMTPRTFEGYTVTSEEVDNLKIVGGHLTQMKARTSTDFEPMSVSAGADDSNEGVSFGGLAYEFTENLRAGTTNFYGWDTFNTFYAETQADHECSWGPDISLGLQFADQQSVGNELAGSTSGQLYGARVSAGFESLIGTVAVTSAEGAGIEKPWGGDPSYNSLMLSDFDRSGEQTLRLGLSYNFDDIGVKGVSAFTNYAWGDTPDYGPNASPDQQEFNITVDYRPDIGDLRNFWLRFRYGFNDRDAGGLGRTDFRVIANYSIDF